MAQESKESPQEQNLGRAVSETSPKSGAGIAFYNGYMPPLEIQLKDGSTTWCKYGELDQVVKGLKATHREREGHV